MKAVYENALIIRIRRTAEGKHVVISQHDNRKPTPKECPCGIHRLDCDYHK